MNTTFRHLLFAIVFFVACAAGRAAGISGVEITVKRTAGGKTMKQVKTDASGNSSPSVRYRFYGWRGKELKYLSPP